MRGADPMLDQSNWPPAWTRAHALAAACTWLPVTDGEEALLEAAERFAAWIESDNERRAVRPISPGQEVERRGAGDLDGRAYAESFSRDGEDGRTSAARGSTHHQSPNRFAHPERNPMSLTVQGVPESIKRSRVTQMLADLGIDASQVTRHGIQIDWHGIRCEVFAKNENGDRYAVGDRAATHMVTIRIEDDE